MKHIHDNAFNDYKEATAFWHAQLKNRDAKTETDPDTKETLIGVKKPTEIQLVDMFSFSKQIKGNGRELKDDENPESLLRKPSTFTFDAKAAMDEIMGGTRDMLEHESAGASRSGQAPPMLQHPGFTGSLDA